MPDTLTVTAVRTNPIVIETEYAIPGGYTAKIHYACKSILVDTGKWIVDLEEHWISPAHGVMGTFTCDVPFVGRGSATSEWIALTAMEEAMKRTGVTFVNRAPPPFGPPGPATAHQKMWDESITVAIVGRALDRLAEPVGVGCRCGEQLTVTKDTIRGALQCWKCGARYAC